MKKVNHVIFLCITICFLCSCNAQSTINQLDFMEGTWKIENKSTYENWQKEKGDQFIGYSYKLQEGSKKITETLAIKKIDNLLVYQATVPNQNAGKTISFNLNTSIKDKFSFENLAHDFPKKIQYQKLDESTLYVQVLGENDQGFSYRLIKQ
ncbi:DUF6265 family protein [Aquimarina sp. 2201CG14-23]|uniref:DUF6265 family protein n=1 Tax=Aquimarina mycalae TaxID=3040073 RepID=UPI002477F658|nr:DUF6265 family protein [Aquimarina sp. 2201CG14-23]MDH7446875.1 DUF6265 family protein [Aquimarina sp. 2201CG14-23]